MITIPNGVIDARKAAFDAWIAPLTTLIDAIERVAVLNLNTLRSLVEDATANVRSMVEAAAAPDELLGLPSGWMETAARRALAYQRSSYEIVAQGVEEAVKPFEVHFSEMNKLVAANLEKAAKSAPMGSEVAIAAVQTAIAAANSTFDSVSKATRQVVELTETSLANTGLAVARATASAALPPPVKRSA